MFEAIRSFFRRPSTPAHTLQRRLFVAQKELNDELQALMRAYARRVAYLQTHLVDRHPEEVQRDRTFFESAQQSLKRITARLHVADQEADVLLREWHDWITQSEEKTLPQEAMERLELLRSELVVRGLLPATSERVRISTPTVSAQKKRISYQPTVLAEDAFTAFDEVYAPRLQQESAWLERAWQKSLQVGVRLPWRVWLTHRRKRIYGWRRRLGKVLS